MPDATLEQLIPSESLEPPAIADALGEFYEGDYSQNEALCRELMRLTIRLQDK
jgi:hypothetical protein